LIKEEMIMVYQERIYEGGGLATQIPPEIATPVVGVKVVPPRSCAAAGASSRLMAA
jgi:hypothetical protein